MEIERIEKEKIEALPSRVGPLKAKEMVMAERSSKLYFGKSS